MNIFTRSFVSVWKIMVAVALLYCTYLLFLVKTQLELYFGIAFLAFVTLPTIFVVYFKKKFIANHPKFAKGWKFLRFFYYVVLIVFAAILSFGLYRFYENYKTAQAIKIINSEKITLDDVMGAHLPPVPNAYLNNVNVAGFDANNNGIRDDVELAIFKEYPNSARVRAAELQYAQALQLELTQVFNSETLVAVMQKEDLAFDCLGFSGPDTSLSMADNKQKEVDNLVMNTEMRKKRDIYVFKNYMTSYASLPGNECDINLSSLPN